MELTLQKEHIEELKFRQDSGGWEYLINNEKRIIEYLDAYEEE